MSLAANADALATETSRSVSDEQLVEIAWSAIFRRSLHRSVF
jgi:hypothetical protein